MALYRAGVDVGSTTVKLVIVDENNNILYGDYCRHCAHTQEKLAELLKKARAKLGGRIGVLGDNECLHILSLAFPYRAALMAVRRSLYSS